MTTYVFNQYFLTFIKTVKKNAKPLKEKKTPNNEFGILSKKLLTFGKTFRNDNTFDNLIGFNKKQKYFKSNNIIAYGKDSPYRKLLKSNTSKKLDLFKL